MKQPTQQTRPAVLGDISEPLIAMADDVMRAEQELSLPGDQSYHRRNYVRALFAFIDGTIYMLKQTTLSKSLASEIPLSTKEHALLAEESVNLAHAGALPNRPKFLPIEDNLRFMVKALNRAYASSVELDVSAAPWSAFKAAIAARHRITHPKGLSEFEVSDKELVQCQRVSGWFNYLMVQLIKAIHDSGKPKRK